MQPLRPRHLLVAAAYVGVTGLLLTLTLSIADLTLRFALLASIVIALILPLGIRAIKGRLDIFEPIVIANFALGVMFVGRPLSDLITDEMTTLRYDVTITFNETLFVALVGISFFQIGYFAPIGRTFSRLLPSPPSLRTSSATKSGLLYLLIGGLLFSVFLSRAGGLDALLVLLEGREHSNEAIFRSSTGYLYDGILLWGASSLIFFALAAITKRRVYLLLFFVPTLSLLIFYGARGTRSMLLPLVIALPVFWYLWRARRPRLRTLLIAALVGVTLLGWLREVRTANEDRDFMGTLFVALSSPFNEAMNVLSGHDAEMFDALAIALQVIPEQLPYQHGATVTDVLIRAIPRPLWPNKPLESNDAIVATLWPAHYEVMRAAPAFSILGPFYADSGYITAAFGMFFVGALLSIFWRWLQLHQTKPVAQLIYAMGLPFVVILIRGTIPDTLSRMLFLVLPIVLLIWLPRLTIGPTRPKAPSRTTL